MANRLYYAAQAVSINGSVITGVQSLGISTTYNLEPVFQLGRLSVYEDVQDLADVEVTISKLINGTAPLYLLCTASSSGSSGSSGGSSGSLGLGSGLPLNTLAERTCDVTVTAFDDTANNLDLNTRTAVNAVQMNGMYLSNVSYTLPVEGNLTEDVTLIGQNHSTTTGTAAFPGAGGFVGRRQMVGAASGMQQVTISVDLSREPLYQLGTFAPTVRLLNFPVEVTSEWESLALGAGAGDASASEPGCSSYGSSTGESLSVSICNGASSGSSGSSNTMTINLGSNNVITSVNYSGGDAGGGNVTVTTSYRNYNSFSITVSGTFATLT